MLLRGLLRALPPTGRGPRFPRPPLLAARTLLPGLVVLATVAPPAAAAPEAPSHAPPAALPEVVADAFSAADLAHSAQRVAPGGRLFVSGVELDAGAPAEALELERVRVLTGDARIVVHGDDGVEERPLPRHAHFRGRVAGDLASLALLSVREDGRVRGVVQRNGRTWTLGEGAPGVAQGASGAGDALGSAGTSLGPRPLVAREAVAGPDGTEPFTCGRDQLPLAPGDPRAALAGLNLGGPALDGEELSATAASTSGALTTTPYTARIGVETDYEFFLKFGNTDDAVAYVLDLFAYASALYDQEIDTNLLVSYLSLWTTSADPWTQTSVTCGLYEFGRWWNDNRGDVDRTLAHFLSGKSSNAGVAWLGVLCNGGFNVNLGTSCPGLSPSIDNYGGGYGYSGGLDANFDLGNPSIVWDSVVVTHEIGHNFSSDHTHCYNGLGGSSEPVDQCYNGEAPFGCYAGTAQLPCNPRVDGCGTIMSYCHLLGGGLANIAPTFGTGHPHGVLPQRVPDQMRSHVENRVGSNPSCLARLDCRALTRGVGSGSGTAPAALPESTFGCAAGSYLVGEVVDLEATPAAGWRVASWNGTDDDASTWVKNTLTMPNAATEVTVTYAEGCDDLLLDSGTDNGTILHDACGTLTAGTSYRVGGTGAVTLRSTQRVVLTNGFRVDSGGSLAVVVP